MEFFKSKVLDSRNIFVVLTGLALSVVVGANSVRAEVLHPAQSVFASALPLIELPAPVSGVASVCVVDAGADVTPDTQTALLGRHAVGGVGDVGDHSLDKHGTRMVASIAAPRGKGWGMVGAWPAAKVVSVRADSTYFVRGIIECLSLRHQYNIKVIEIATGFPGIKPGHDPHMQNAIAMARLAGLSIVAAAGNDGGEIDAPANHPGVFAVGAVDGNGDFCSFPDGSGSARGPELGISALGCGLDLALPDGRDGRGAGTSEASAFVSGVVAALRSYRPDLTHDDVENLLQATARHTSAGLVVNVDAAFRAAGLSGVWDDAARRVPQLPQRISGPGGGGPVGPVAYFVSSRRPSPGSGLVAPRLVVKRKGAKRLVKVTNRPVRSRLVLYRSGKRLKVVRGNSFAAPSKGRFSVVFEIGSRRSRHVVLTAGRGL